MLVLVVPAPSRFLPTHWLLAGGVSRPPLLPPRAHGRSSHAARSFPYLEWVQKCFHCAECGHRTTVGPKHIVSSGALVLIATPTYRHSPIYLKKVAARKSVTNAKSEAIVSGLRAGRGEKVECQRVHYSDRVRDSTHDESTAKRCASATRPPRPARHFRFWRGRCAWGCTRT